jgi:serine/threonine-protein phosphatase 2A activator
MSSEPIKRIISTHNLQQFIASQTYTDLIDFITRLNNSIINVKLSDQIPQSLVCQHFLYLVLTLELTWSERIKVIDQLLAILDKVEIIIQQTPPIDNGQSRFGNPAFRTFYDTLKSVESSPPVLRSSLAIILTEKSIIQQSHQLHSTITGLPADMITEVSTYFTESWGNRTRIDYGSGMELNFICWLSVLASDVKLFMFFAD